jgi:hypothetical protein
VQFRGFAPGLSIPVVTANIEYEMNQALEILFSARRKLGQDASAQVQLKYLRGRRNLENKGQGADHRADPCDKANPNAAHGLEMAGKNCNKKEIVIPTEEEIAEDVLTADNADTATETFVSVLDVIFTNDSYETTVLEGGTSETFEENLVTVTNSVGEIENAVASNDNIGEDDKAKAQACLDKVKELLELLAGVVEGPQV